MLFRDDLDWIWQMYKKVREGDLVIRSGFGLCGVYDYDPNSEINYRRPESDSEHANCCVEIARNISRAYPGLFSLKEWLRIFDLLKYHDLGEVAYGDVPDDGTRDAKEKNTTELAAFRKAVSHLPEMHAKVLIQDFKDFQALDFGPAPKMDAFQYKLVSFCKLCDKMDAVLRAIVYELNGVGGDLDYKAKHHPPVSSRDAFYASCTGTTKIAPNWALHFLDFCHGYPHFSFFFAILRAAVCEVNGGFFYHWLPEAKLLFDITDEDLFYYPI